MSQLPQLGRPTTVIEDFARMIQGLNAATLNVLHQMLTVQRDQVTAHEINAHQIAQMIGGPAVDARHMTPTYAPFRSPMFTSSFNGATETAPVSLDSATPPANVAPPVSSETSNKATNQIKATKNGKGKKVNDWRVVTKKKSPKFRYNFKVDAERVSKAYGDYEEQVHHFCGNEDCKCVYIFLTANDEDKDDPAGYQPARIYGNQLFFAWSKTVVSGANEEKVKDFILELFGQDVKTYNFVFKKGYGFVSCKNHEHATLAQTILMENNFTANFAINKDPEFGRRKVEEDQKADDKDLPQEGEGAADNQNVN